MFILAVADGAIAVCPSGYHVILTGKTNKNVWPNILFCHMHIVTQRCAPLQQLQLLLGLKWLGQRKVKGF